MFWTVPEIWAGQTVYVIGGGPSILKTDLSPIHDKPVLGINNAFMLGHWVDVTFFGDIAWWHLNFAELCRHPNLIVTCNATDIFKAMTRVKQVRKNNRNGLSWKGKNEVCWNNSSGAAGINLAILFGATKIVLLGFDMKRDEENGLHQGHNWHDKHDRKKAGPPLPTIYRDRFLPAMDTLKKGIQEMNDSGGHRKVIVVNATPDTVMDTFPKVALEDVV